MKKALLAVMAVVLVVGFSGCDIFGGGSPYLPLKDGNTWDYETVATTEMDYPDDYIIADTTIETTTTSKTEVVGETELDDGTKVTELKTGESSHYVMIDGDGVHYYDAKDATEAWYTHPKKPAVGDKWDVTVEVIVGTDTTSATTTYEVVADAETANEYSDCLKISVTPESTDAYDEYESFMYWAPKVGNVMATMKTVMTTTLGEEDNLVTTMESETKLTGTNFE